MSRVSDYFSNAKRAAGSSNSKSFIFELHQIAMAIKRGGLSEALADQKFRSCLINHGYSPSDLDMAKFEAERIKGFDYSQPAYHAVSQKVVKNKNLFSGVNEKNFLAGLGMSYRKQEKKGRAVKSMAAFDLGNEMGLNTGKNIGGRIDLEKELGLNGHVSKMGFPLHENKKDRALNAVNVDKMLGINSGVPKMFKESQNVFALKKKNKREPKDLMKKLLWG